MPSDHKVTTTILFPSQIIFAINLFNPKKNHSMSPKIRKVVNPAKAFSKKREAETILAADGSTEFSVDGSYLRSNSN
jgi:hypothetical protein